MFSRSGCFVFVGAFDDPAYTWWPSHGGGIPVVIELNFVTSYFLRPNLRLWFSWALLWLSVGTVVLTAPMKFCKSQNISPIFGFGLVAKLFRQARRHLVGPGAAHVSVLHMVRS